VTIINQEVGTKAKAITHSSFQQLLQSKAAEGCVRTGI